MNQSGLRRIVLSGLVACVIGPAQAGSLLQETFDGAKAWPDAKTDLNPATPLPIECDVSVAAVGTIDKADTTEKSNALSFTADVGDAPADWQAVAASGLLAVKNTETDLAKLTLSFDLSVSFCRPVTVRIESFDAAKKRTGGLEGVVYPAAPDFFIRSAVDLSTMKPTGDGTFRPADPFVQITYAIDGRAWPKNAKYEVRVDNVGYAGPSYYVSPKGDDKNDGLTEKTPFEHPQTAVDRAKPGDIILLMDGAHTRGGGNGVQDGLAHLESGGTPAAWLVIKNCPGHKPLLSNTDSWETIRIGGTFKKPDVPEQPIAYIEVRGLHIRGNAERVKQVCPDDMNKPTPTTNGGGVGITGRGRKLTPHHVRVADNLIELAGGGVSMIETDWMTVENNTVLNNCWFTIYAGSGISILGPRNWDGVDNAHKMLIRNNRVAGNRCYLPWQKIGRFSDGNGIIVDSTVTTAKTYLGRVLVQNNLSVNNGGSGIHAFKSSRVDFVNNTAYYNGATPALGWGQIFLQRVPDSTVVNNVMFTRPGQPINGVSLRTNDKENKNIKRTNNVLFGSDTLPIKADTDRVADPMFVRASVLPGEMDFGLKTGSPAIGFAKPSPLTPLTDIDGRPRPFDTGIDAGAFQR